MRGGGVTGRINEVLRAGGGQAISSVVCPKGIVTHKKLSGSGKFAYYYNAWWVGGVTKMLLPPPSRRISGIVLNTDTGSGFG